MHYLRVKDGGLAAADDHSHGPTPCPSPGGVRPDSLDAAVARDPEKQWLEGRDLPYPPYYGLPVTVSRSPLPRVRDSNLATRANCLEAGKPAVGHDCDPAPLAVYLTANTSLFADSGKPAEIDLRGKA
jgi:hypothetical protein